MADVIRMLDKEREQAGLTAEQFAVRVGIPSSSYSRQKNGKQLPRLETIQQYAIFARERGNVRLLQELGAYVLNMEPEQINIVE